MLFGPWAGSMQNMHPGLGAAVDQHSKFFDERWERLYRSLYPIYGVVFDGPRAPETARRVRGYHDTIKGVDDRGRKYHALDPDTFYWAHATFFDSLVVSVEWFDGPLPLADKHRLFDEHVQWHRMYGMSMRPVPESWEAFLDYGDHMCRNVLEDNKATRDVLDLSRLDRPPFLQWFPAPVWHAVRPIVTRGFLWLTVATATIRGPAPGGTASPVVSGTMHHSCTLRHGTCRRSIAVTPRSTTVRRSLHTELGDSAASRGQLPRHATLSA
jgi:uncharacterized protein (DUF2236 family)